MPAKKHHAQPEGDKNILCPRKLPASPIKKLTVWSQPINNKHF